MNINFREIDRSNYNECIGLSLRDDQKDYVATNAYSLVQAAYEENLYPLGVYNNDIMVGFILYDFDEEINGWSFSRFMIDINHQGKGYGGAAMEKFLEFFHSKYPNEKLYTSVEVENHVAMALYEKHGFVKQNQFEYTINGKIYREYRMLKESFN